MGQLIGNLVWLYAWLVLRAAASHELPRNASIILGGVAIGVVVMLAYSYSPSTLAMVGGFIATGCAVLLLRHLAPPCSTRRVYR